MYVAWPSSKTAEGKTTGGADTTVAGTHVPGIALVITGEAWSNPFTDEDEEMLGR